MATKQTFTAGQVLTAAQMNTLQGYVGAVQVVTTNKTDNFSTSSATYVDVTGVSVSITPTSATNKVLVIVQGIVTDEAGGSGGRMNLLRGSTNIAQSTGATNNQTLPIEAGLNGNPFSIVFVDSPATTSATTYKIQVRINAGGSSITIGSNRLNVYGGHTTITAIEVTP